MEESASADYEFQVITVGDCAVGKTSIILRFAEGVFDETLTTIASLDWTKKTLEYNGYSVYLRLIDTSGQEKHGTLTNQYCRHGDAILLCYDVTNLDSFLHLNYWRQKLGFPFTKPVFLVGNKVDLDKGTMVSTGQGQTHAGNLHKGGVPFYEVSAKTGAGIDSLFDHVVSQLVSRTQRVGSISRDSIVLSTEQNKHQRRNKCCKN